MIRSKSHGLFFADLCSSFATIFNFGALFRDEADVVHDLYRNVHFMDTLDLVDPQPINEADRNFNQLHRPMKFEEGRQDLYREIDAIQPQKRMVLVKNLKTGNTNFRALSMGLRDGHFDYRVDAEFEQTKPTLKFKEQAERRAASIKRKRLRNIQIDMAIKDNLRKRARIVMAEIEHQKMLEEEEKRLERERLANATRETRKGTRASKNIVHDPFDRTQEYQRAILEYELEQELVRQQKLAEDLVTQAKDRERSKVKDMLAESARIVEKLKLKLGMKVMGKRYPDKPQKQFEDDVRLYTRKFKESSIKMKKKLDFFYGPYAKRSVSQRKPSSASRLDDQNAVRQHLNHHLRGILHRGTKNQRNGFSLLKNKAKSQHGQHPPLKMSSLAKQVSVANRMMMTHKKKQITTVQFRNTTLKSLKKRDNLDLKAFRGQAVDGVMEPMAFPNRDSNKDIEEDRVKLNLFIKFPTQKLGSRRISYNSDEHASKKSRSNWAKIADYIINKPCASTLTRLCSRVSHFSSYEARRKRRLQGLQNSEGGDEEMSKHEKSSHFSERGNYALTEKINLSFRRASKLRPKDGSATPKKPLASLKKLLNQKPLQGDLSEDSAESIVTPVSPKASLMKTKSSRIRSRFLIKNIELAKERQGFKGGESKRGSKRLAVDCSRVNSSQAINTGHTATPQSALTKQSDKKLYDQTAVPPLKQEWLRKQELSQKGAPTAIGSGLESQESGLGQTTRRTVNNTLLTQRSLVNSQFRQLNLSKPGPFAKPTLQKKKSCAEQNFRDYLNEDYPTAALRPSLSTLVHNPADQVESPRLIEQNRPVPQALKPMLVSLPHHPSEGLTTQTDGDEIPPVKPSGMNQRTITRVNLRSDLGQYIRNKLHLQRQLKSQLSNWKDDRLVPQGGKVFSLPQISLNDKIVSKELNKRQQRSSFHRSKHDTTTFSSSEPSLKQQPPPQDDSPVSLVEMPSVSFNVTSVVAKDTSFSNVEAKQKPAFLMQQSLMRASLE